MAFKQNPHLDLFDVSEFEAELDQLEDSLLLDQSRTKKQKYFDRMARRIQVKYGKTPLEVLMEIAAGQNASINQRIVAATAAMPYVHQKLPTAVEVTGEVEHNHKLAGAKDRLTEALERAIAVVTVDGPAAMGRVIDQTPPDRTDEADQ